jgi:tetratricopeptide (TPR) repeat protein
MKEPVRLFNLTLFLRLFRLTILSFFLLILLFFPLRAQKQDSVALFSLLKTKDKHKKLNALEKIYKEYYRFFPIEAHPYVLQALSISRKLNDKEAETDACNAISNYYSSVGNIDSAFYFGKAGLEISKFINSKTYIAKSYGRLGEVYRTKGDKATAIDFLKKAIELDPASQGSVAGYCQNLGLMYADAGCPEKSVYYYLRALKIREERHQLIDAGYLYCNLSGFYFQPPYTDQGFKTIEKAIDLFRQAKFPKGESYADNLIGMNYFSRMDYQEALKYYRKSLALNSLDTLTIRSGYSFNLTNIGDTWLKLKQFDSAQFYYSRALSFSTRDQDYIPMACTYLSLGEMNTQQKKYAKAIEFLNKGLYYSKLANFRAQWEEAYNLLSECYEANGDQEKALVYLKKRNEIKDSIVTEKAHHEVANMMIKYETQKKDEQISILNVDSHNKQTKIRIAVFMILMIFSLSGVLAYLAWLYYRKKLMPKVRTLDFIQEKITIEKEGDNRRLRALDKILPPKLKPFTTIQQPWAEINKDLMVHLEALLIRDKIYLNEDLTLAETARQLDTNTTYLSRLINEHYQVNFSAFLNRYRIEEAKKMILDDQFNNFSIEGIAKSSGFRSKSTFNQVFKNSTGLTPTEFAIQNGKVRV